MLGMPPGLGYFTRRSSRTARKLVPPFCPAEKINFIVGNIIRVAHAVKRYYRPLTFILNVAGFYDPLLALFDRAVEDGFLRAQNRDMALVDTDIERLLERMAAYRAEPVTKWLTRAQAT